MKSRPDIHFSASSIQDYLDCPRRFQLRYILEQPWPAAESEPLLEYEIRRERGAQFHQLLERYYLGIDENTLTDMILDPVIQGWWKYHLTESPIDRLTSKKILPEKFLQTKLLNYTLTAFIDLVVIKNDDSLVIVDWKTTNKKPTHDFWSNHIQTLVYLYITGEKAADLSGHPIPLSSIKMLYWFVEYPDQPVFIDYSNAMHAEAQNRLASLITSISERLTDRPALEWPKTTHLAQCQFCAYRSLCDRGVEAGLALEFSDSDDLMLEVDVDT